MGTTVGVRELKENAPRLVKRAAGGERIVITRYGKPAAVLGPAEPESTGRDARRAEFEREKEAFERMLPRLLERIPGKWVAVHAGRLVDEDRDEDRLFRRVRRRLGDKSLYVGRVSAEPPTIFMTGFEIAE